MKINKLINNINDFVYKIAQTTHQVGEEKAILQGILKQVPYPKGTLFGTLTADTGDTQIDGSSGVVTKLVSSAGNVTGDIDLVINVDAAGKVSINGKGPGNVVASANSVFAKAMTGAIAKYKDKMGLVIPAGGFSIPWVNLSLSASSDE